MLAAAAMMMLLVIEAGADQIDDVDTCEYVGLLGSVSTVARQSGRDLSAGNHYDDGHGGGDVDDGDACGDDSGDDHNEAKADEVYTYNTRDIHKFLLPPRYEGIPEYENVYFQIFLESPRCKGNR